MFKKLRRYFAIIKVFFKYNLFSLLYKEIQSNYVSNKKITCSVDREAQKNARKLRLAFEDLGVTFIKLGQIMSKRPDLIPFSYVQELSQLQNKVGLISFEEIGASFEGYNIGCQTKDVADPYSESIAAFEAFLKIANINKYEIDIHKFKVDLDSLISLQNFALGERQNDSYANLAFKYNLSLPSDFQPLNVLWYWLKVSALNLTLSSISSKMQKH